MLIIATSGRFKKIVAESVQQTIRDAEDTYLSLATTRKALAELQIQQARKEEEWARREREIEHKIGLERKRQEFEIEQSKREATAKVQQENLAADKDRFKSEMDFQRTHLQGEVKGLRETTATTANTGNYVIKMQQTHSMPYPLMDRKIVFQDYGSIVGPPARKATNAEWLDKRVAEIRYKP